MNSTINNGAINTSGTESTGLDNIGHGASQVGIGIILSLAALVGVWGTVCLISGLTKSGGLVAMARGYMTALGM